MTATPHERGAGFRLDPREIENHRTPQPPENPVALMPEARMIADIYREILDGSPIGIGAGMGGLIPEKLLWTQVEAYCRVQRMRLNRWTLGLIFLLDSIRLKYEFERIKKEAEKPKG